MLGKIGDLRPQFFLYYKLNKGDYMKKFGTAIILAGGKSSRMGFDKQFVKVNKKRLMDSIIAKLEEEFEEIIIVSNKPEEYSQYSQRILPDKIKDVGPLGGIYTGLMEAKFKYSFIIACDMPNINVDYIKYMKDAMENKSVDICITKIGDNIEPFHGFYSKETAEYIGKYLLKGRRKIKDLAEELNTLYIEEEFARKYSPELIIFENLNTQKDLKCFSKSLSASKCNSSIKT